MNRVSLAIAILVSALRTFPALGQSPGDYGNLPLSFIENEGQLDSRVGYYIQGGDKSIYFTDRGVTFALTGEDKTLLKPPRLHPVSDRRTADTGQSGPPGQAQRWVLQLDFVDANPNVRPVGQDAADTVISYFKGPRNEWKTGLPTYGSVVYQDLWPGIDIVYMGTGGRLKYDFLVRPGADPSQIKLAYRGAKAVGIYETGQLYVSTPLGSFEEDIPYAYQDVDGRRVEVAAAYSLNNEDNETSEGVHFGFDVGTYDRDQLLVIDPLFLLYAGFIGGTGNDMASSIAVDAAGNAYVTGRTVSTAATFPVSIGPDLTHNGGGDAFVAKVNAQGTALVYLGYIGGSDDDAGIGIGVDSSGSAHIAGYTRSTEATFPVTVGPDLTYNGKLDLFVAKVNATGTALDFAGYIGGSGDDQTRGMAVDATDNTYVTGWTDSTEATFPVTVGPDLTYNGGIRDAFVVKVNAAGAALDYAGYIGGSGRENISGGGGIAVDSTGSAYVTGDTNSQVPSFPVTVGPDLTPNGGSDAFVVKVNASGTALDYAGYIGGSDADTGRSIAVDSSGNAYVTGNTGSDETEGFPVTSGPDLTYNGGTGDAFVAKVNAAGTALDYAGYIGGSGANDLGYDIAVGSSGNAYISGRTDSTEATFPVTVGPDLTYNGGQSDGFVAKVNAAGTALDFAGYIGGANNGGGGDQDEVEGIALDNEGNVYVTGWTDSTEATFPVSMGPDLTYNGGNDAFVMKISETPPGPCPVTTATAGTADILRSVYRFRDSVMARSERGRALTRLFYLHAMEGSTLMFRYPELRRRTADVLARIQPHLDGMAGGDAVLVSRDDAEGIVSVSRDDAEAVVSLMRAFYYKASPELRRAIVYLYRQLRSGRLLSFAQRPDALK